MEKQEKRIPHYLQDIVNDISFENLPVTWQGFDFSKFSKDKTLFDFQKDALKNALKGLWLYLKEKNADKQALFEHYRLNGFEEDFDYYMNRERKAAKYLLEYPNEYESVKHENVLPSSMNEITAFYYRSDLLSDEQKEKILNFRNYDNGGKWYILLDEAHKGDKEDSIR